MIIKVLATAQIARQHSGQFFFLIGAVE